MDEVRNKTGIFFSVWLDEKAARANRANYNIHALKLRKLEDYSITSRDFAAEFRDSFVPMSNAWPNVSVDFGPLTLMQGWIEIDMKRLEDDVLLLLERFSQVSPVIDELLKKRQVPRKPA